MAFEFKLPDLGEGVSEGEILRWLVQVGDVVSPEQPVVEVMTDKVSAELPSPVGGRVTRLGGAPGDLIPVHSPLIWIETPDDESPAPHPMHPAGVPETAGDAAAPESLATAGPGGNGAPLAVPAVRRLGKELGVDLRTVAGTGPHGRILEADVRAAAAGDHSSTAESTVGRNLPAHQGTGSQSEVRRVPLRGVRRAIAEHLLEAHQNTAPYTLVEEVDFTELVGVRERVLPLAERAGVRLTYLPLVLAAVSMALREHPELNATVEPASGDLLVHSAQHFSLAVHTEEGLQVPVIQNGGQRNLLDLAREIERLTAAARGGRLSHEEVQGGTFTVSNLGPRGGLLGTPMLNVPQVATLGIHRIGLRPAIRNGEVTPRQMANVSLTLDHRYIDGHAGAEFLSTLKSYLEDPAVMLFWLAEIREH